ncbi:hypothetical protein ABPG72_015462 [Tetrahymena utriculariae]
MIVGCFRGCFSLNAETTFEKARLQATYSGDYEPPAESDIQQILQTLAGNDPETRPDVAFQLIQSKMQYSESKNQWNYLVKNLIILDRCVEDRSFVNDIATIHILHVENFKDPDPRNSIIKIDGFIRKYFQYIKMKSKLYAKKNSSFNVNKREKRQYFLSIPTDKIFFEMAESLTLFQFMIDLVRTNTDPLKRVSKRGYLEYKLNQYVFHLMLYTMLNLYTTMFIVISVLLERLTEQTLDEANKTKDVYMKFLKCNEQFSQFVDDHKFIKGYQEIKPSDFYQPNRNTLQVIQDWIQLLDSRKNMQDPDAVVIQIDQDVNLPKIIIEKVVKYPVKTNNQVNFLGDEENCVYIKQASSELRPVQQQQMNESDSIDGGIFRLDKQDSLTTGVFPNVDDLEKFSIFNSQRLSDDSNTRFQFGKNTKNSTKILENANTGFCKDFFQVYKNEYSSSFSKNSKYMTQQLYTNKFEKCNLLEQYFEKSFQNTVSFMINDRLTTHLDASIKQLPNFEEQIFFDFKNEFSVVEPMHYTYDDSKIKYQPEQVKQKEIQSQMKVQDVYTIQGADTTKASELLAQIMKKNKSYNEKTEENIQFKTSPYKSLVNSQKQENQYQLSPLKENQDKEQAFIPSPINDHENQDSKQNQIDYKIYYNDEEENGLYTKQNNTHQKDEPRYQDQEYQYNNLSNQIYDHNQADDSTNILSSSHKFSNEIIKNANQEETYDHEIHYENYLNNNEHTIATESNQNY